MNKRIWDAAGRTCVVDDVDAALPFYTTHPGFGWKPIELFQPAQR